MTKGMLVRKRYLRKSTCWRSEFSGKTFDEYIQGSVMVEAVITLILYYAFCFLPELLIIFFWGGY